MEITRDDLCSHNEPKIHCCICKGIRLVKVTKKLGYGRDIGQAIHSELDALPPHRKELKFYIVRTMDGIEGLLYTSALIETPVIIFGEMTILYHGTHLDSYLGFMAGLHLQCAIPNFDGQMRVEGEWNEKINSVYMTDLSTDQIFSDFKDVNAVFDFSDDTVSHQLCARTPDAFAAGLHVALEFPVDWMNEELNPMYAWDGCTYREDSDDVHDLGEVFERPELKKNPVAVFYIVENLDRSKLEIEE